MNLDFATAFNAAVTLAAFLGGWVLKSLFERINTLDTDVKMVVKAVAELREALPTHYVRRDDFKQALDNIFNSLRRIEDKMENKADKP